MGFDRKNQSYFPSFGVTIIPVLYVPALSTATEQVFKNAKVTKRTEVAKDIFENKEESGGKNITEKPKSKEEHAFGKLNNLCDLDNFTDNEFFKKSAPTKRTDVGKDILKEFKNVKADDDDDDDKYEKKGKVVKRVI